MSKSFRSLDCQGLWRPLGTAILLLLVSASATFGAETIENGTFDANISPWQTLNPDLAIEWSPVDVFDSASSGSIKITSSSATDNGAFGAVTQCVLVTPELRYRFGAKAFIPSGQAFPVQVTMIVAFYGTSNCLDSPGFPDRHFGPELSAVGTWQTIDGGEVQAPEFAHSAQVSIAVRKVGDGGSVVAHFDDVSLLELVGNCESSAQRLCLNSGRFAVEVEWTRPDGGSGKGTAVPMANDSGLFWFFASSNLEMLVKVLDACAINDRFWFFAAATTDVAYRLTVTDTETNTIAQYLNPQGVASPAITDTNAFATCP